MNIRLLSVFLACLSGLSASDALPGGHTLTLKISGVL
jgi:hypothetical protein